MVQTPIYTVGYGARSFEALIDVLAQYGIGYLIDVRSRPYSKYKPAFSREPLRHALGPTGIRYVYMGDLLGGQPADPECYVDGKVDYRICKTKSFFQKGLERLETAYRKNLAVALMCGEGKPDGCHRSKLIGVSLAEREIDVRHIDEHGGLKSQEEVMASLTGGQLSLLAGGDWISRKQYAVASGEGQGDASF